MLSDMRIDTQCIPMFKDMSLVLDIYKISCISDMSLILSVFKKPAVK